MKQPYVGPDDACEALRSIVPLLFGKVDRLQASYVVAVLVIDRPVNCSCVYGEYRCGDQEGKERGCSPSNVDFHCELAGNWMSVSSHAVMLKYLLYCGCAVDHRRTLWDGFCTGNLGRGSFFGEPSVMTRKKRSQLGRIEFR
jgi:hypothetical protein